MSLQELSFLWRSYCQAGRLRFLVTGQPAPLTQPFASLTSGNSIVALSTSHTYKNVDASSNAPSIPPAEAELAFPLLQRPHFTALLVPALRAKLQTLRPGAGFGGRRNSRVLAQRTNNALKSVRAYATTVLESPNASAAAAADGIELSGAQSVYDPIAPTKGHRSGAVRAPLLLLDEATWVQVRPEVSVTVAVAVPTLPSVASMATSRLPGGGANQVVCVEVADAVHVVPGLAALSARVPVPAALISAAATLPPVSAVLVPITIGVAAVVVLVLRNV